MCLATTSRPTARVKPARTRRPVASLLLVIAAEPYRLRPFVDRPGAMVDWCHVLQGPDGRRFEVGEREYTFDEINAAVDGEPFHSKYLCEACGEGRCVHVEALREVGLL